MTHSVTFQQVSGKVNLIWRGGVSLNSQCRTMFYDSKIIAVLLKCSKNFVALF